MRISDYASMYAEYPKQKIAKKEPKEADSSSRSNESSDAKTATGKTQSDAVVKDTADISEEAMQKSKDTADISEEAMQKSKDINDELQKMENEISWFKEQMEITRKQSEGAAEQWDILIKCLKIAMRIMSGDIVPKADHRFLMKNKPELYSKAIMMRVHNDSPKKHKRLSKDDKKKDESNSVNNNESDAPGNTLKDVVENEASPESPEEELLPEE